MTTGRTGATADVTKWHTTGTTRLLLAALNYTLYFKDNRDNRNNKKNRRNCGMSRGDIQLGQQDYLCCHRFRASLLRQLLKFSLEGCTKRSGRNPGHSPGIMCDRKTVCKTVPCYVATDGEVLPYRQLHRHISPRAAPPCSSPSGQIASESERSA